MAAFGSRGPSEAPAKTPEREPGTRCQNFIYIIARNFPPHSIQSAFLQAHQQRSVAFQLFENVYREGGLGDFRPGLRVAQGKRRPNGLSSIISRSTELGFLRLNAQTEYASE